MKNIQSLFLSLSLLTICGTISCGAQEASPISEIIGKIQILEENKDPKCYATANRLEDFMYGTPLTDAARNLKIDIQKELIYYLKLKGTEHAKEEGAQKISKIHLNTVLSEISEFVRQQNGNFQYQLTTGTITILKRDYEQYSSVSYGYRSLLSVEQDILYFSEDKLLSFDDSALKRANEYVNLLTLVTLKIADIKARKANQKTISKELLQHTWLLILNESKNKNTLATISYPSIQSKKPIPSLQNKLVREIIQQKIASYTTYNALSESVFLRNIQVYFARQKWPTQSETSNALRSYYLESLIQFTKALLEQSHQDALSNNHPIIRVDAVQNALNDFLPSYTNTFEDVTFFPNNATQKITLESYDLDAFRDSGFHWRILGYALDDITENKLKDLDPNAAEQLVEGIAQMGVLVLRLAGVHSHDQNRTVLQLDDITKAFESIQLLISSYGGFQNITADTTIQSSDKNTAPLVGFQDVTNTIGVDFQHKSSDWLNRLIRGYTTATKEGVIKLAIPPAFGGSGVACEDLNNDGRIEILLLSGFGNKLYLNTKTGGFLDISEKSNISIWDEALNSYGEVRQPIIADFNNDGLQDIFITYVNAPHRLYKNTGNAQFIEVSAEANLQGKNAVAGPATTFDYDNDGLLDLFIGYFGNYTQGALPTLSRDNQNGMPNKLFKNMGGFVFREVPFTKDPSSNNGWTQAIGHSDINQDGWQDLIVGNDFGKNKYYLNNGNGLFSEMSTQLGTDKPSYTMNVGITDLNKDQYPDFYISNIVVMQKDEKYVSPNAETTMKFDPKKMANIRTVEANDLFLSNVKNNSLLNFSLSENVGRGYTATGWSWDADFFDYDNDGDEDLYCLNGMNDFSVYSSENPFYFERAEQSKAITYAESNREKNVFFINEGGALINKAEELGTDLNSNARSASYFDFDNDGDLDIIINNYHEKATVLQNNAAKENRWLKIKLIGDPNYNINRDAIGSSMVVTSENHSLWREVHSTSGYLSVHPKEQHFGLGTDTAVNIEVRWSNGRIVELKNLQVNKQYEISYPNRLELKN